MPVHPQTVVQVETEKTHLLEPVQQYITSLTVVVVVPVVGEQLEIVITVVVEEEQVVRVLRGLRLRVIQEHLEHHPQPQIKVREVKEQYRQRVVVLQNMGVVVEEVQPRLRVITQHWVQEVVHYLVVREEVTEVVFIILVSLTVLVVVFQVLIHKAVEELKVHQT